MLVLNNHGVFLLEMIILGCEMGVPPFQETPNLVGGLKPSEKYAKVKFDHLCQVWGKNEKVSNHHPAFKTP